MELAKAYDPKEAESRHYERWEQLGCFRPEINEDAEAEAYSIVIPPPNVTGSLHMGHALQHTIMDVLARWKRMQGYRTLWLPGTDHAGISVQRKVVEQLRAEENKSPLDIGREEFLKRCWAWKEEYGNTIIEQMRREGASVDWTRHRFTMDPGLSAAVRSVFVTLYEEGQIYRGLRIVNWCPKDKTVLSDLEVKEETKKDGKLYYLKYPVSEPPVVAGGLTQESENIQPPATAGGSDFIVVATTRPETMLGDTAVAVNPGDERYKDLIGKFIALPLTNREIPIIADEYVDAEFGTGAVKITPAHDPNDYLVGERHGLEQLLVMNMDGTMNEAAGAEFEGLDRFKAREKVVAMFDELGLLEKIEDYEITLPVCERCKTVVEPILSEQWFVKMDELRDIGLDLINREGVPRFVPEVPHAKVYTTWLENLKDWTISRQLWWGHQIPAWYDSDGNVYVAHSEEEAREKAGGRELVQDSDVLDTWFSSGLWAFSTFGWTGPSEPPAVAGGSMRETPNVQPPATAGGSDLETFLPTDVLVTGRDIIFLWVSRMMMLTKKFTGQTAFKDCVITGTVLGKDGKPMSKSRKNGVDPIEMFDKFGVDATRIYLASIATGADIKWNDLLIETYRNFANKIWNATRFSLMNVGPQVASLQADESRLAACAPAAPLADRWIISRLNRTALELNKALEKYEFHTAVSLLYHFFWDDFCDWYIELTKSEPPAVAGGLTQDSENVQPPATAGGSDSSGVTLNVLETALRMLHPFMPYLTEELWQKLPGTSAEMHHAAYRSVPPAVAGGLAQNSESVQPPATAGGSDKTIMLADFPRGDASLIDETAEFEMSAVIDAIKKARNIRAEMNISPSVRFAVHLAANSDLQRVFRENQPQILRLARAETLVISDALDVPKASAKAVLTANASLAVPLEGLIDFDKERERLANAIAKLSEEKTRLDAQLTNENFVTRAPAEKVEALRERSAELAGQIETLNVNLASLS
ncbi:MAG: valine--tRNA ligase [Acidobacteriota bacterium]|nr:MAG: valine--tRNA ligase [Acidobacteriota bacterium]